MSNYSTDENMDEKLPTRRGSQEHRTNTNLQIKPSSHVMHKTMFDESKSDMNASRSTSRKENTDSEVHSITSAVQSMNEMPCVDNDIRITKLYLQKQGAQNQSVWSHLTNVLNKIIAEQPENVIDYFEEYSRKVKEEQLLDPSLLQEVYVPLPHLESAKNQLSLLTSEVVKEDAEGEEEPVAGEEEEETEPSPQMDLEEAAFYFREAGIGLPDFQLFNINIAMKKVVKENGIVKPRFWGKILGIKQDYFVLEGELTDEEYQKRIEAEEMEEAAEAERLAAEAEEEEGQEEGEEAVEEEAAKSSVIGAEGPTESQTSTKESLKSEDQTSMDSKHYMQKIYLADDDKIGEKPPEDEEDPLLPPLPPPKKLLTYKVPPLLKPVPKETVKIPAEKYGEGLNKKIYYVCNTPELNWEELPKVTPELINVSKQIQVYFTGDLESKLVTYPAFPGDEKHYLRAQIARISAATQVSPIGFYKFAGGGGGEEEEEEEAAEEEEEGGGGQKAIEFNKKFQPIPIKDLTDPSLASWVHHSRYILKQGRADWYSAKKGEAGEDEEAEEEQEEEEDEEKEGGEEKETGPPLLTPLSEDEPVDGVAPWTVRRTRSYNPSLAGAVVSSNVWPGACAFAVGKKSENIYCGWGHKHNAHGFSPVPLPHPEYEYDLGPEIMEIQDPTVEVEQAWREAHKKKPPPVEGEEGEEEGEGEEEEEEEEDD